ncbi:MAG TPA: IclR family transcriptional regulator [Mycobacteriales bacterium]|jgi:IclR family acetate operon transcriptional repressor|nr:IclR family transcriptional regulator [Mycobacteriales bacterium]
MDTDRVGTPGPDGGGGVQSLNRAFDLLERLADAGGTLGVSELAAATGLPLPTIHRLLRSLTISGYVRQEQSRRYALGGRLIRLGDAASRALGVWAVPHLRRLVTEVAETANMAMLDGDAAVYVAQVPSPHSMRMFTEVGRRVLTHCTGVGKALLSQLEDAEVLELVRRAGLPARTEHTITTPDRLLGELARIRDQGYALDEGEQEIGVRCLAVPVDGGPGRIAVSVSGPSGRLTEERIPEIVPVLHRVAKELGTELRREALPG